MLVMRHIKGFTLVELMIALAVFAILSALAAPSFRASIRRGQLGMAAGDFHAALNLARSEAITRGHGVMVLPVDGTNWESGWIIVPDPNGNKMQDDGEAAIFNHEALLGGLSVTGGVAPVIYNSYGRAQAASWVFASGDGPTRKVIINFLGRARRCDPATEASC